MRLIVLSVLMTVCVPLSIAAAQDAKSQAKAQYKKGAAHLKAGEHTPALRAFEEANRLAPHPVMLKNIAKVYRAMNDYGNAIAYFERYLREFQTSQGKPAKDQSKVRQTIATMRATRAGWPSLRLESNPSKAEIRIDDPNGPVRTRTNTTLRMPAGSYVLYISKPGYQTARREFLFEQGRSRRLKVALSPNGGPVGVAPVVRTRPRPQPQPPTARPQVQRPLVATQPQVRPTPPTPRPAPKPAARPVPVPTARPVPSNVPPVAVAQSGTVDELPATEAASTGVSASSDASFNAGRWGMISMIAGGALVVGGISMGAVASQTSANLDTCRSNPACNRTDRE